MGENRAGPIPRDGRFIAGENGARRGADWRGRAAVWSPCGVWVGRMGVRSRALARAAAAQRSERRGGTVGSRANLERPASNHLAFGPTMDSRIVGRFLH